MDYTWIEIELFPFTRPSEQLVSTSPTQLYFCIWKEKERTTSTTTVSLYARRAFFKLSISKVTKLTQEETFFSLFYSLSQSILSQQSNKENESKRKRRRRKKSRERMQLMCRQLSLYLLFCRVRPPAGSKWPEDRKIKDSVSVRKGMKGQTTSSEEILFLFFSFFLWFFLSFFLSVQRLLLSFSCCG